MDKNTFLFVVLLLVLAWYIYFKPAENVLYVVAGLAFFAILATFSKGSD